MGLWRSGSALPWHGRGRGFDSPQLHQEIARAQSIFALSPFLLGLPERKKNIPVKILKTSRYKGFAPLVSAFSLFLRENQLKIVHLVS